MIAGRLLSVNVGTRASLRDGDQIVTTAIVKQPVTERVLVGRLGLKGDQQADLRHHGGPDKAVNAYPHEHFAYWAERLGRSLGPGAFGENLTSVGWREDVVRIGDIYQVGQSLLQVTQPRQPCRKLAAHIGERRMVRWVVESEKTGFYLRCIDPGRLAAGDPIARVKGPEESMTVAEAHRVMHFEVDNRRATERLLDCPGLSAAWHETLRRRLTNE